MNIKERFEKRPLSWSQISCWEYSPDEWYRRYILNEKSPENPAMIFGKLFAHSCEIRKPLAPVELYKEVEYPMKVVFNDIPLIGYADTYEPHSKLGEHKTGKAWDQKKVDGHRQFDMYLFMLYITHKVPPEEIECILNWVPTVETGDFKINFVKPIKVHSFKTKRTMPDLLRFGQRINTDVKLMQEYVNSK